MISCLINHVDISSCSLPIKKMLIFDYEDNTKIEPIYNSSFKLPLEYLDKKYIHPLSPTVLQDLELVKPQNAGSRPIYDIVFKPKHDFAKKMITKWSSKFTSHIPFLEESQKVIIEQGIYIKKMSQRGEDSYQFNHEKISDVWASIKEDSNFLERYSFMEFEFLKHFNESTSFLQILSFINIVSPIATFLIPIIFLILPFLLLKMQGIPIDFEKYTEVLKEIAKHHMIGKTIKSMENVSINSVVYLFITIALYFLQIYQNIVSLLRFYKNICKVNENLFEMKQYVDYSILSMDSFIEINKDRCYYYEFCKDLEKHSKVFKKIREELSYIHSGKFNILKTGDMGYMLKCYYLLHDVKEYEESLRFSFSFEGYINNLNGIHENLESKYISLANFYPEGESVSPKDDTKNKLIIKKQYYPPYYNENYVTNDCKLDKNMVITGVNASGKTTYLKSTTLNIIFTQQFGMGFYESLTIHPYTHIHSYLNIPDTSERDSLFQAESRRCKEIIDIIGPLKEESKNRHFCIFDELYSGTNPDDATKTAYAFLSYLCDFPNVDFILTTHYTSICKKIGGKGNDGKGNDGKGNCKRGSDGDGTDTRNSGEEISKMCNYKMNVDKTDDGKLVYTYKLKKGICRIKGAYEILKNMDYPEEILSKLR